MAVIERSYTGRLTRVAGTTVAVALAVWLGAFLARPEALRRLTWPLAFCFALLGWKRWRLAVDLAIVNLPLWLLVPMRLGQPNFSLVEIALFAAAFGAALRVAQTGQFRWVKTSATPYMALMGLAAAISLILYFLEWFHVADWLFGRVLLGQFASVFHMPNGSKFYALRGALTLLEGFVFFHVVAARVRDVRDVRHVVQLSLFSALLVSIFGIGQYFTNWNRVDFEPWGHRINSTFPDVNSLASFLVANLFMLAALLTVDPRKRPRGVAWWVLPLLLVSLWMAHSRAAFAALALTLPLYLVLRSRRLRLEKTVVWLYKKRKVLAACFVLLLLILGFVFMGLDWVFHTDLDWTRTTGPVARALRGRLNIWRSGFYNVAQSPWLGRGVGTFFSFLAWHWESVAASAEWNWNPIQENAHNYFIQIMVEMGVIGLGLFLLILAKIFYQGLRALTIHPIAERPLVAGMVCGLAAFLLTCLTGHPLLLVDLNLWFWAIAALLFVRSEAESVEYALEQEHQRGFRRLVLAMLLVATVVRLPATLRPRPTTFIGAGIHDIEYIDAEQRRYAFAWLAKRAVCQVYQMYPDLEFCLRNVLGEKRPITVTVRVNGREIDRVRLADDRWRLCSYRLPETVRTTIKLELISDYEWTPPGDRRRLAVQIQSLWDNSRPYL